MNNLEEIKRVEDLISNLNKLKGLSNIKSKQFFIDGLYKDESNSLFFRVLKYLLDPCEISGLNKARLKKKIPQKTKDLVEVVDWTLDDLLDYVIEHNTGSDATNLHVQRYIDNIGVYQDELRDIFTKSFKLGVNKTTINKFIPNFIQVIEFMRAKNYMDRYEKGLFNFNKRYQISEKLDGIRCCFIKDNSGNVTAYSRQGKVIKGLVPIEDALKTDHFECGAVYDGELLAIGEFETDELRFQKTCSVINSNDADKTEIEFIMFDMIDEERFFKGYSDLEHELRMEDIDDMVSSYRNNTEEPLVINSIHNRPFYKIGQFTHEELIDMVEECDRVGKEGIMINDLEAPWTGKRTDSILKLKKNLIADVRIVGFVEGEGKHTGVLGAIEVEFEYNGEMQRCFVGTGFSDKERFNIWYHKEDYLNKIVEVNYQKITKPVNGTGYALGFASWNHRVRDDKDETNL